MYTKPMIFPLDADGVLYALHDEKGNHIATGSRQVCHTLLYLITTSPLIAKPASRARRSRAKTKTQCVAVRT